MTTVVNPCTRHCLHRHSKPKVLNCFSVHRKHQKTGIVARAQRRAVGPLVFATVPIEYLYYSWVSTSYYTNHSAVRQKRSNCYVAVWYLAMLRHTANNNNNEYAANVATIARHSCHRPRKIGTTVSCRPISWVLILPQRRRRQHQQRQCSCCDDDDHPR